MSPLDELMDSIQDTHSARDVNNTQIDAGYATSQSSEESSGEKKSILELLERQIEANE